MNFSIVAAVNKTNGIGFDNIIPWKNSEDLKFFSTLTIGLQKNNAVIMGYKTWESLPTKPLPDRLNIVITSALLKVQDVIFVDNFKDAINTCVEKNINDVFVIGGERLYKSTIGSFLCKTLYISQIDNYEKCDKFFPIFDEVNIYKEREFKLHNNFTLVRYERENYEEKQYLDLIKHVLRHGTKTDDRTGTGTISIFGNMMKFSLEDGKIPVLTTKKIFWKGVVEELLWFIRGSTNNKELKDKGVHIWDNDSSKETHQKRGFTYEEDDVAAVYGFQWRHFGAKYIDCNTDYSGQGFDQLEWLINEIKTNPNSRRLILTAWNPPDIEKMCLPPCHFSSQFNVIDGKLSCMLIQRSCDVGLGVPFNIASYALFTHILANCCGLKPGELIYSMGNVHIYNNHVDQLQEQVKRIPYSFPTIKIVQNRDKIENHVFEDFKLIDYKYHPGIKMNVSY